MITDGSKLMDTQFARDVDPEDCPLCNSSQVTQVFHSELGVSVRSNSAPWQGSVKILQCDQCDHVFKPLALSQPAADYKNYPAMSNQCTEDKVDFSLPYPVQRSKRILDFIKTFEQLNPLTRVLDYGCHRGAFLRLLDAGAHAGFDLSEDYRSTVESMGLSFYSKQTELPRAEFDVAVMIHVLEHFLHAEEDIKALVNTLKPGGKLLVQVPDFMTQPTDLYIMDHRHHFYAHSLRQMMSVLGFSAMQKEQRMIAGELTGMYQINTERNRSELEPRRDKSHRLAIAQRIEYLNRGEADLVRLKQSGQAYWVYGAGNLGVLIATYLGTQVKGYIDDQPSRQGTLISGLRVCALDAVPQADAVIIAVPSAAVGRPVIACAERELDYHVPFGELNLSGSTEHMQNSEQMQERFRAFHYD